MRAESRQPGSPGDLRLERFSTALRDLESSRSAFEPPPDFAARLLRRLPASCAGPGGAEILGWAALRLLPIGIALLVAAGLLAVDLERRSLRAATETWVSSASWSEPGAETDDASLTWLALASSGDAADSTSAPAAGESR